MNEKGGINLGDFGYSRTAAQPVVELIKHRFPNTLDLTIWVVAPVILVGIWLGVQAAVHHNGFIDQGCENVQYRWHFIPNLCVRSVDADDLLCQPRMGPPGKLSDWANLAINSEGFVTYTSLTTIDAILNGRFDIFLDALRHMAMPILTLSYQLGDLPARDPRLNARNPAHGICHNRPCAEGSA